MTNFPIGVMLESFCTPIPQAIEQAAAMGAKGVQVYVTRGELDLEILVGDKLADFKNRLAAAGLEVSALCGDFGHGFGDAAMNPALIEKSKRILDLGKELGTNIVTTHVGVIPEDVNHPRYKIMQDACGELAAYADTMNAHFAIETGPETAVVLKGFLDSLHSKGVAVNLDPANFVMVTGDDPVKAVTLLQDYIVHTHAKDGKRNYYKDPEIVYGLIEEEIQKADSFVELPLGEGAVDFKAYLAELDRVGYRGYLTIEREVGADPAADIQLAMDFLKNIMAGGK